MQTVETVINHYGSPVQLAKAIGMQVRNVYHWRRKGYISSGACDLIEEESEGQFRAIELRKMAKKARGRGLYERRQSEK